MPGRRQDQDLMSFDANWLLLSLIPGGIGSILLIYGKKMGRFPQLFAGLALLIYPYFATTMLSLIVVGVVIIVALWVAVRLGW